MKIADRIEIDPRVCNGKAVIKGTRIPVSVILELVAAGVSWEEVLSDYPELKQTETRGYPGRALLRERFNHRHDNSRSPFSFAANACVRGRKTHRKPRFRTGSYSVFRLERRSAQALS